MIPKIVPQIAIVLIYLAWAGIWLHNLWEMRDDYRATNSERKLVVVYGGGGLVMAIVIFITLADALGVVSK